MKQARFLVLALAIPAILVTALAPAEATRPPFVFPAGCCFYNGTVVRTVVPPSSTPKAGIDNFYAFPSGGADGQLGIAAVAPGDAGKYHGGHWKFFAVSFNSGITPYLLTSEAAVLTAQTAGDVTVAQDPSSDFKCPIQP